MGPTTLSAPPNSLVTKVDAKLARALVVEDDPRVARSIARWLRSNDVSVAVASRGSDLPALGSDFDIGIFDIDLPDTNGVELARECLSKGIVRRAVFFSGSKDLELRRMAEDLGEFVDKSAGTNGLSERVLSAYRPSSIPASLRAVG
ncbi:MAG TPA: response regulator [Polyangiaceae bacterium]|jgi:DNA-binding response OmpR family regulator|nr:response regulator [Polyangiaceae bacterium]